MPQNFQLVDEANTQHDEIYQHAKKQLKVTQGLLDKEKRRVVE